MRVEGDVDHVRREFLTPATVGAPVWLACLGIWGSVLASCTPLKPGSDAPLNDESTSAETNSGALRDSWSCLGSLGRADTVLPGADESRRWVYSAQALSFFSGQPIPALTVRACQSADLACSQPIAEVGPADADGWIDVPITEGFRGYFEFTAPTIVPAIWFHYQLLPGNGSMNYPVIMLDPQSATSIAAALGQPLDPSLGLIGMTTYDCNGIPAPGITVTHDRGGTPWYLVDGIPSFAPRSTSAQGIGGFVNVAPGISVLQASREGAGLLAPAQAVFVRPGWFTAVVSDPSGSRR